MVGTSYTFAFTNGGLIAADYLLELNSGLLSHVLVIVVWLAWLFWRFRLSLMTIVSMMLTVPTLVLTNVKFFFRAQVWTAQEELSQGEKLEVWREGFEQLQVMILLLTIVSICFPRVRD